MTELSIGVGEIDRKYEILEKMAEGGMGEIYKARHRLLDEIRVIKTIHSAHRESEELQKRFLREAKVATGLKHPGIAELHDFTIDDDGTACIVMEFIQGTDLAKAFTADAPAPTELTLEIARQTLAALGYLHRQRVVHRDISPDNVMLSYDERGRPRISLIDLGIAKSLENTQGMTRTGTFIGKVKYASPEQLQRGQAGDIDGRSDLYSFGVVLYQLLTQSYPISGTDEASILAGHLLQPPRSFEETDPDGRISPPLRAVLMKSLEKLPDNRFSSADEFQQALDAAAEGVAPPQTSGSTPEASGERPGVTPTVLVGPAEPAVEPERAPAAPREGVSRRLLLRAAGGLAAVAAAVFIGLWVSGRAGGDREFDDGPVLAGIDFGTYHALVVGNDNYELLPQLQTAANDARAVGELLERKYGFQVRVLTDATRHEMITALTEIGDTMTAADNLLIYYAGHGWLDATNQTGYWQPVDAEPTNTSNWISTKHEISGVLSSVAAQHILVVADSCYSGSLADSPANPRADLGPPPSAEARRDEIEELLGRRSRLALTSGGLSPVLDEGDGTHSIFARVLLDVLERNPRAVEVSRLFGEISRRVPQAARAFGADQNPQLASISRAGDEGGEFFFVPAHRPPPGGRRPPAGGSR